MSAQDDGPKDDSSSKITDNAESREEIDQDREAILARRKFMVLGALSGIALGAQACDTPVGRLIGLPSACLSPAPCLSVPERRHDVPTGVADAAEPAPMPCLEPVQVIPNELDVPVVPESYPHPCLSPPLPPVRDAGVRVRVPQPHPTACLRMRVMPHPPPLNPPCLTPARPCLNMLKPQDDEDES